MYEINGVPIRMQALQARARELGITFEELVARNSDTLVKVGEEPLQATNLPENNQVLEEDGVILPSPQEIPGYEETMDKSRQNLTPSQEETIASQEKVKSYQDQIKEYNNQIEAILNTPNTTGEQRLEMVNELQKPSIGTVINEGVSDIANLPDAPSIKDDNEYNVADLNSNYYNENQAKLKIIEQEIENSENKEESYDKIFNETFQRKSRSI